MWVYLLVSLALLPFVLQPDPALGLGHTRTEAGNLDCERISAETADRRRPGTTRTSSPRGDYVERSEIVCRERLMRPGLRTPRDEAILSTLNAQATGFAATATSLRPDLASRTWLVQAHYGSAQVESKLTFATQAALVGQGLQVSDRRPTLAVGDVEVLTRLPPEDAYAAACTRYAANGSLRDDDVLLAIVSRDPRETTLHAGLCVGGRWGWLQ